MMWLLYIVSFVLQDVFKVYPYCNMYQYFTPFLWLNDIPMNRRTTFGYPSVDGHLSCSHFLGIMNNTAMNIHGTILCAHVFISLRCVPRSGIAGGCLCLSFFFGGGGGLPNLFQNAEPFHLPASSAAEHAPLF